MKNNLLRVCRPALLLVLLILPCVARAEENDLPTAKPEQVGLSAERLQRIHAVLQDYVDRGKLSGAVVVIARRGKLAYLDALGWDDVEARSQMNRRTIFRMASSSKPVTAVAILMLMEEGKLQLGDPVSKFLPEFKKMKVKETMPLTGEPEPVPAKRAITILDLLTHRSGLGSGLAASKEMMAVMKAKKDTDTLADFVPKMAAVPLDFQPGSEWRYSGLAGFDTLSRVVEVASGKTFDEFLRQRLFEPLGMKDTFFVVPADRKARLAKIYKTTPKGLEKIEFFKFLDNPHYFSGAGGLASTAEDYARFGQMLLSGGQLNGKRVLGPRTVELMSANHVGSMFEGQLGRPKGIGFGLGVEVVQDAVQANWRRSNGSYGWDGAFGTTFWVDPREQMVAVLMVQVANREIHRAFENAVRQAIIE
jgi:CubicO group peptidase (beta-lactamase class C family)